MTRIAIIPARGGSKRIPRKNIKPFLGKPILSYSIETALESQLFSEVMVSTEDDEIAELALQCGATVPFRRSEQTANDYAGTAEVLLEVLDSYGSLGRFFDYGCCIYPTAPFIKVELLHHAWRMLFENNYDTVFPVLRYSSPIQRALRIEDDRVIMFWPGNYTLRSQDLTPAYHDAGQFYWFNCVALRQKRQLWTDRSKAIVISDWDAQDIDTPEDWQMAEFKYCYRSAKGCQ
ncbi:pseudaminic acid cytidylyltransferase [Candidatus Chloroploca asiatica]|uniref:Pseudaminic acid cytidylyltransferase n=1 Tax=Candidatus Chloroploca asiatica TaxID=1506545 RepID=A0A2H3KP78_9CHLR|nr:pseudaminic acid cytidylyltransferase [Candidatus Chloroploca asiatica]PDV99988.1 pseudaminic acid cytidylyltransferase [Candidatus Chloroploca asiatica]